MTSRLGSTGFLLVLPDMPGVQAAATFVRKPVWLQSVVAEPVISLAVFPTSGVVPGFLNGWWKNHPYGGKCFRYRNLQYYRNVNDNE